MSFQSGKAGDAGQQQSYVHDQSYVGALPQQGAYMYGLQQPGAYPQMAGYPQAAVYPQVVTVTSLLPPNSYLAWSIISLIFLCLPFGIAALVYSLGVSADYAAGLHAEARRKSVVARNLNIVATVLGIVIWIVGGLAIGMFVRSYNRIIYG